MATPTMQETGLMMDVNELTYRADVLDSMASDPRGVNRDVLYRAAERTASVAVALLGRLTEWYYYLPRADWETMTRACVAAGDRAIAIRNANKPS